MIVIAVLALVFAILPTAWLLFPSFRSYRVGGGRDVPLKFLVIDQLTGKPIAGAKVLVNHPLHLIAPRQGMTDEDGRAVLTAVATASGKLVTAEVEGVYRVTVWKTERLSLSSGSISVAARGYEAVQVPIPGGSVRSTIMIRLRPGQDSSVGKSISRDVRSSGG